MSASTAELLDALRALAVTGLDDPQVVRATLQTCLIKRSEDESRFVDLFELFFLRAGSLLSDFAESPLVDALRKAGLTDEQIEHVMAQLATEAARLDPTARMGLGLRQVGLDLLLRLSGLRIDVSRMQSPLQTGYFTQGMLDRLRFREADAELRSLFERLTPQLAPEQSKEKNEKK